MTVQRPEDFETGLEDFDMTDAVIPRLTINHPEGLFRDSLSGEEFPKLRVIIQGLVKQRVLWHPTVDEGDWPMCRSGNHETGFPNVSDDQPREKRFPWAASKFDPADFQPDDDGLIRLPCNGCQLKEWGSHPDGKKPYCAEQFTLPILYQTPEQEGEEIWVPAIVTFQKTSLKPLKAYLTSFARSRSAAYQAITEMGLDLQRRGTTTYSTPNFRKVGDTDDTNWREYSVNYRAMAEFLRADPGSREESVDEPTPAAPAANKNTGPAKTEPKAEEPADTVDAEIVEDVPQQANAAPAAEPAKAAPEQAAGADDDDDELPF